MDMTIAQIARVTGYNRESLRRLAKSGKLPGAYRLSGRWLVNKETFDAIRQGKSPAIRENGERKTEKEGKY
jgi:excisionase family DNA binding protein